MIQTSGFVTPQYDKTQWKLELTEKRDVCLLTKLADEKVVPGEVYAIRHSGDVSIHSIEQSNETDFVYYAGELMKVRDPAHGAIYWKFMGRYSVRLQDGEVHCLDVQTFTYDWQTGLCTEKGQKACKSLIDHNGVEKAEPIFERCEFLGKYDYDTKRYELVDSKGFFILREKCASKRKGRPKKNGGEPTFTGGGERLYVTRCNMPCLGLKQIDNSKFIGIFCRSNGELILKRFVARPETSDFGVRIDGNGWSPRRHNSEYLELFNEFCQIDADNIMTKHGVYNFRHDSISGDTSDFMRKVIVREKKTGKTHALELCCHGSEYNPVMTLYLYDPIKHVAFGDVMDFRTGEFERARTASDVWELTKRLEDKYWKDVQRSRNADDS